MLCPLVVLNGFNSATTVYLNSHEEMVVLSSEQRTVWKLKELKSLLTFSRSWSKFPDCRKRNQTCCWRAVSRQEVLLSHWQGHGGCSTSPTFSTGWGQDRPSWGHWCPFQEFKSASHLSTMAWGELFSTWTTWLRGWVGTSRIWDYCSNTHLWRAALAF